MKWKEKQMYTDFKQKTAIARGKIWTWKRKENLRETESLLIVAQKRTP